MNSFVAVPTVVGSVSLLVGLGAIAIKGIGESAKMAAVLTGLEVLGLLLVIWLGRKTFTQIDVGGLFAIDPAVGLGGVFAGAFLAFYAFIGFEDMLNMAGEARNSSRTMPLASLIVIKRRHRDHGGYVDVPTSIPYLGVVLCLGTIVFQVFNW